MQQFFLFKLNRSAIQLIECVTETNLQTNCLAYKNVILRGILRSQDNDYSQTYGYHENVYVGVCQRERENFIHPATQFMHGNNLVHDGIQFCS